MKRARVRQPSKKRSQEVTPLTPEEIEALADNTRNDRERLAVLLMGFAGLRAGEVGGLRVEDVHFEEPCQVSIRRQAIQDGGRKETDAPLKTNAARRTIAVACSVVENLAVLVPGAAEDGRLFHADNGGVWAAVRINEAVHRAAKAAGITRNVHSHMLRHTAVSLLIRAGANPRAIQAFVGHSDIKRHSEHTDTYSTSPARGSPTSWRVCGTEATGSDRAEGAEPGEHVRAAPGWCKARRRNDAVREPVHAGRSRRRCEARSGCPAAS